MKIFNVLDFSQCMNDKDVHYILCSIMKVISSSGKFWINNKRSDLSVMGFHFDDKYFLSDEVCRK